MMKIVPLGAGQDVGRSCIIVTMGDDSTGTKNIMFDCGMHMGYNDKRRFPDFSYISKTGGNFTEMLDCIIVSHFHLDHCGALPYFTEMCGYDGPIYMTYPTKAICPILLEDYRRITVERKGETDFFTAQMIKDCMKKVTAVNLHQTVKVNGDDDFEIKAYYAGHVLGAAMFSVRVGQQTVVYTGDYNMTPDRHLGAAWIDKVRPDVLITESTYATTIRDSKRSRERDFLKKVHDCVNSGGKVLIPVFALGRAQELCILIETYWERNNLTVPVYFSAGMTERANEYYKLFINWTNEKIKSTFVHRNMFDFKHIQAWNRAYLDKEGAAVLFASPGMLHVGTSLEVFKKWAPDPKNMVIMPGYCVAGTVGAKVLAGEKKIHVDAFTVIDVKLQVRNLSFSAHADAKGIMQLIKQCEPRNVVLVHGEKSKMEFLQEKIKREFPEVDGCFFPANGTTISIDTSLNIPVDVSVGLLKKYLAEKNSQTRANISLWSLNKVKPYNSVPISGMLVMQPNKPVRLLTPTEGASQIGLQLHELTFDVWKTIDDQVFWKKWGSRVSGLGRELRYAALKVVEDALMKRFGDDLLITREKTRIVVRTFVVAIVSDTANKLKITWNYRDEELANALMAIVDDVLP
ncbi:7600_t:CDS:2 [Paraglomus occultum]|uniref:7600_t:CDS:1 n=1 Tax=Paraglomus occultum TaxID=144539 RepID=A0A9N8WFE7_9GLOM|nr:7600_t:CDS:2 [Paraglomus occultum]